MPDLVGHYSRRALSYSRGGKWFYENWKGRVLSEERTFDRCSTILSRVTEQACVFTHSHMNDAAGARCSLRYSYKCEQGYLPFVYVGTSALYAMMRTMLKYECVHVKVAEGRNPIMKKMRESGQLNVVYKLRLLNEPRPTRNRPIRLVSTQLSTNPPWPFLNDLAATSHTLESPSATDHTIKQTPTTFLVRIDEPPRLFSPSLARAVFSSAVISSVPSFLPSNPRSLQAPPLKPLSFTALLPALRTRLERWLSRTVGKTQSTTAPRLLLAARFYTRHRFCRNFFDLSMSSIIFSHPLELSTIEEPSF